MALRVSEDAQSIDEILRVKAAEAAEAFAHLLEKAEKRKTEPLPVKKTASGWSDKIAKMRETHPNAYRPWEKSHDDELKQEFQNGLDLKELSALLGRHEGSIKIRLQKHFGEDVVQ